MMKIYNAMVIMISRLNIRGSFLLGGCDGLAGGVSLDSGGRGSVLSVLH
jgi:hypothetical protein